MDKEFLDYSPKDYPVELTIGPNAGDRAQGSITISTNPFVLTKLLHLIVSDATAPTPVVQDGAYTIDWSISEQTKFFAQPVPMADSYGSVRHGIWDPISPPLSIRDQVTINVEIVNRLNGRPGNFVVQVIFRGYETKPQKWQPLTK